MKDVFFIWLGDIIPKYAFYALDNYKHLNNSYNFKIIHYTIQQIENIYIHKKINSQYDDILYKSINYIFTNIDLIYKCYSYEISQLHYDMSKVRFIQVLSNAFRTFLINECTGIYLDCDTFPVKPFDDELFSQDSFIVNRHDHLMNNSIISDNYFFGSIKKFVFDKNKIELTDYKTTSKQLLQTIPNWKNNIQFKIAQRKFFDCKLQLNEFSFDKNFYITHFADGRWRAKNNSVRVQYSILDNILKEKIAYGKN